MMIVPIKIGYTREKSLQSLAKQGLLKGANTCKLEFCEHYVIGKKTKVKFDTAIHCTERILDYIYIDVCEPTKTFIRGNNYFVSFIDDFSRRYWVYIMRHKGKVLKLFVKWKREMEKNTRRKIKILHSDNNGEYTNPFLQL